MRHIILRLALTFTLFLLLGNSISVRAEKVSQKEAKKVAELFFNAAYGAKMPQPKYVYNGKNLSTGRFLTPFYLFNQPAGGFVIIAADNKAFPILAYDMSRQFDRNDIDSTMLALFTLYTQHIEHIRFDHNTTDKAINAWTNLPQHIHSILSADESEMDIKYDESEVMRRISEVQESDIPTINSQLSVTYTPNQWEDLTSQELVERHNVASAIIENGKINPILIYGQKGDMYRVKLGNNNSGWYRLMPTEVISFGYITSFINPQIEEEKVYEEPPFTFLNQFKTEIRKEQEAQQAAIENATNITTPVIRRIGGGHYAITIPEEIAHVSLFSINGASILHSTFKNTTTAFINIASSPNGFYIATILGKSGQSYGVKLFR